MCGFAGIVGKNSRKPNQEVLRRMGEAIVHRGPDEDGYFVDDTAGFAFRRLRIIDLRTGSQPLTNEDGQIVVVFNGEIYNFRELRSDLQSRGHVFKTTSDTEVLVHLYEEHGERLVDFLNGMFAFALWDRRKKQLVLARDPVGIKPLLYSLTEDGITFGSEMGSLLEGGLPDQSLDPVALELHLSWGSIPAPHTIFQSVRRLPPAHTLVWTSQGARLSRYWHPLDRSQEAPRSYEEGREELRSLLDDSVRRQVVSDVPLGAFLSGGVDSTAVVGLMTQHLDHVHTFSVGFADAPIFDETRYARAAAEFHQTHHSEAHLQCHEARDLIPSLLDGLAEPFGGASLLPTHLVSRETRRHMTVALSGDGADELFAGYNKYLGETYRQWASHFPEPMLRGFLETTCHALPVTRRNRLGEMGRKARRFLEGLEDDGALRHDRWMRFARAPEVHALLGRSANSRASEQDETSTRLLREVQSDYDSRGLVDPLNRILFTDFMVALPSDMLTKVDLASMQCSLEVRVPFLDPRVVQLAFAMPGIWKMRGTRRKIILKDAVRDLLPPPVRNRPKAGFDVPVGEWMKSPLRDLVHDVLFARDTGRIALDRNVLTRLVEEHEKGRADHTKILWAALTLRWWDQRLAPHGRATESDVASAIDTKTAPMTPNLPAEPELMGTS